MFINIQNPSDTQKGDLRKAIRSQAALSSANSRKNTIAAKAASSSSSPDESDQPPGKRRKSKARATNDQGKTSELILSPKAPTRLDPESLPPQANGWNTRSDPFRTYPSAGSWHVSIPRLVDTYLMHIAPNEQDLVYSSSRPKLRKELWPEILSHSPLFYASLLIATSHQSFLDDATSSVIAWYRYQAVRSIQSGINSSTSSRVSDQLIAAVSLVCGWELEFGDEAAFTAHLAGLKTMIATRGGLEASGISPIVCQVVLSVTQNLFLYAGIETVFDVEGVQSRSRKSNVETLDLPEGFETLRRSCLIFPMTLELVAELCGIMKRTRHRKRTLQDLQYRLKEYEYTKHLPVDFCPIQSSVDDAVNYQAEKHIKAALLSLIARLQETSCDTNHEMYGQLVPAILSNTVYAEVSTWALFVICGIAAHSPSTLVSGLKRLLSSQGIVAWSQADQLLRRFIYPQDELGSRCRILWEQINHNEVIGPQRDAFSRYDKTAFTPPQRAILNSPPA